MIYLYLFGTCFHFIYVFMIISKYFLTLKLIKQQLSFFNNIIRQQKNTDIKELNIRSKQNKCTRIITI